MGKEIDKRKDSFCSPQYWMQIWKAVRFYEDTPHCFLISSQKKNPNRLEMLGVTEWLVISNYTSWTQGLSLCIGSIHISKLISKAMRRKHQVTEHSLGPHLAKMMWYGWESLTINTCIFSLLPIWHCVCVLWFWPFGGVGRDGME